MVPICIISDRFQFICICIAKNASSTVRTEFKKSQYRSYECRYNQIDKEKLENYFIFALLRDPVSRLLSAYQELSMRKDGKPLSKEDKPFYSMDDTLDRFHAFLAEVQRHKWDPHVMDQHDYVGDKRIDFLGRVETFNKSMRFVFNTLQVPFSTIFPIMGSRDERKTVYNYVKFHIETVDRTTRDLIREIYKKDVELVSGSHAQQ